MVEQAHNTQVVEQAHNTQVVEQAHNTQVVEQAHNTQVTQQAHNTQMTQQVHNTQVVEQAHNTQVVEQAHNTQVVEQAHNTQVTQQAHNTQVTQQAHNTQVVEQAHNTQMTQQVHNTQVAEQAHNTQAAEQTEVSAVRHSSLQKDKSCGRLHSRKKDLCPAFRKTCPACSKPNHFAKVCKTTGRRTSGRINVVDIEDPETVFDIEALTQTSQRHETHCTVYINTQDVKLQIDTGAKCSVMPVEIYNRVKAHERINRHNAVNLIAYGGDRFSTLGSVNFRCKIGSTTELITFQVIDRQANPILGLNDALRLRLIQLDKTVYEVGCENDDGFSKRMITEHGDLFDEQFGSLPAMYVMRVYPSVPPVVKPARKTPLAMERKVKEELDNMAKKALSLVKLNPQNGYHRWSPPERKTEM